MLNSIFPKLSPTPIDGISPFPALRLPTSVPRLRFLTSARHPLVVLYHPTTPTHPVYTTPSTEAPLKAVLVMMVVLRAFNGVSVGVV